MKDNDTPGAINKILIVCVGNICRSPMAEALLKDALQDMPGYFISSAGLGAPAGCPAAEYAQALMAALGLDISSHRARQLMPEMVRDSDLVLVMESAHKLAIEASEPSVCGKIHRLCRWQNLDIPDPYRQPKSAYEEALQLIELGVSSWVDTLSASTRGGSRR